jgi:hypothetical protein
MVALMNSEQERRFFGEFTCRTPCAGEWVQVNPDPAYRREVTLVIDKGIYYLIAPEFAQEFQDVQAGLAKLNPDYLRRFQQHQQQHVGRPVLQLQVQRSMLFLAANRDGEGFLWPVKLPVSEDHLAYRAMREWVCLPSETRH